MSLTINQEKQLRRTRREISAAERIVRVAEPLLLIYAELAGKVASYRRAQRLPQSKDASDLRKELLGEIDEILEKLGIK